MTQKEIMFINQFQSNLIVPIQEDLLHRKHRNWINEPLSVAIEEILCSLNIHSKTNGEFDLTYTCKGDIVKCSYKLNYPIQHIEHGLWEILQYLELHELKSGLLPAYREINHLKNGIKELLQIINPDIYGTSQHL